MLAIVVILLVILGVPFPSFGEGSESKARMIIMGIDGMDPVMLQELMDEGRTPNLARLRSLGGFIPLGTSIPPQSPVAWVEFHHRHEPWRARHLRFLAFRP